MLPIAYLSTASISHARSFYFQNGLVIYDLIFIYHVSVEARMSGSRLDGLKELNTSPVEDSGFVAGYLRRMKRWLFLHAQHLNFFTILVLASVRLFLYSPNF